MSGGQARARISGRRSLTWQPRRWCWCWRTQWFRRTASTSRKATSSCWRRRSTEACRPACRYSPVQPGCTRPPVAHETHAITTAAGCHGGKQKNLSSWIHAASEGSHHDAGEVLLFCNQFQARHHVLIELFINAAHVWMQYHIHFEIEIFLSSATQWSSLTHRCHKNSMLKVWFLEIHALAHTFIKAEASKQTKTWTFPHFWGWSQQSNFHARSCRPKGVTYRNHPAADIFIQTDFSPNQNINTAVPEGLGLRRRTWYSNLSCDKNM